ncbi:MAG: mechanosensitive ion channel protein MscS [Rhodospirillaceae bacterium]|nr:MAG: mechanosensitive ion channel protein MscS [Rhodospirillaceae bacterium]
MLENLDIPHLIDTYVLPWGINLVMAILVFVIGRLIAKFVVSITRKIMARASMDDILINFIASIISAVLQLVVIIAALNKLGVDTTSLIAVLGAAGLAIGLALKDSLSNFAAGVMLIIFRPIKTGDFVEAAGISGTVEHINIFSSVFRTGDNKEIIVPNGNIYSGVITNYSARDTRRIDMVIGIGYQDNIKQAKDIICEILDAEDRLLKDPAYAVALADLAECSININVRPWVKSSDYWAVRSDFLESVKAKFDEAGVSIPYPQMDVHVVKD